MFNILIRGFSETEQFNVFYIKKKKQYNTQHKLKNKTNVL